MDDEHQKITTLSLNIQRHSPIIDDTEAFRRQLQ